MLLGYSVTAVSNEIFAFLERLDIRRCGLCDMLLERPLDGLRISLPWGTHHLSYTLDGLPIVSREFRQGYQGHDLRGLIFVPATDDSSFFSMQCETRVEFDAVRRKTAVVNRCSCCRRYEQVVGTTPVMLTRTEPLSPDAFYETDLAFGMGDEQHPMLLVGEKAALVLRELGISLEAIES